jgi:signal transduction histidine kinase
MSTYSLLAWLPADHRKPLLLRLLTVWCIALLIALGNWAAHEETHQTFDKALVYAYAISTFIWLFTDVSRFVFKRLLHVQAPHYWPPTLRATLMLLVGIPLGYVLGTLVGDSYAGWSTWDLRHFNPRRFKGMLVSSIAISAAFVAYFYQRGKAESLARQVTQAQLMLLQSQLEPHMLFNTLANLRALIAADPLRAQSMLDHLIAYLRATLSASRQTLRPLHQEFERLRDYLEIMAVRMGPRLSYTLDLPEALAQVTVPTLLLQPLVENALLHGLEPSVEGGSLQISASRIGQELVLEVTDTGCGLAADRLLTSPHSSAGGFGLAQVRERLLSHYGPLATLDIQARQPAGTRARIMLPLNDRAQP